MHGKIVMISLGVGLTGLLGFVGWVAVTLIGLLAK